MIDLLGGIPLEDTADSDICTCGHKKDKHDPMQQAYNGRILTNIVICQVVYSWERGYDGKDHPNAKCMCTVFTPAVKRK